MFEFLKKAIQPGNCGCVKKQTKLGIIDKKERYLETPGC